MDLRSLAILALFACSSPAKNPAPPPTANEVPPQTADPGAVQDQPPLQPAPPPRPEGQAGSGAGSQAAPPKPDGATCFEGAECASGTCEGEGCGISQPGTCAPRARACTRDLRTYCGCDGKPFQSSGSCPGRRFAARKACGA